MMWIRFIKAYVIMPVLLFKLIDQSYGNKSSN